MDFANFVTLVTIFAGILCATGAPFVNTEVYTLEECGHGHCPLQPLIKECKSPEVASNM
jgi:hypothetical protein